MGSVGDTVVCLSNGTVMAEHRPHYVGEILRQFFDRRPVSSGGRASDYRAGGLEFEPQTGPTLRVLKKLRRICCLCNDICKWLHILVFSDKDDKP